MPASYSRKKEEYLAIVKALQREHGNILKIPFFRLNQKRDDPNKMISMPLSTNQCQLLFQRIPRTMDSRDGIQRALKQEKVDEIAEASKSSRYSAPGSMVVSLEVSDRSWGVEVEGNKEERSGWVVIKLAEIANRLSSEEDNFQIGYVIDGHHRLEGHYKAGCIDLEMNTTVYLDLPRAEMARVFAGVNEKQEKPSPTHTLAVKQMAGMLKNPERYAYELAEELNADKDSVMFQRIKMFDGRLPKGHLATYVNLKPFTDLLQRKFICTMHEMPTREQRITAENYFKAWKETFPEAWQDEKKHVLVKSMGFSVMCHLFPVIYDAAFSEFHTKSPELEHFKSIIKVYKGSEIIVSADEYPGLPVPFRLDWSSDVLGSMSSGKGITALGSILERHLRQKRRELAPVKISGASSGQNH